VAGTLTNDCAASLGIGNDYLSASDSVTATSLDNTGVINRRDELSRRARNDIQFRREFGGHRRYAHADRTRV
jgi:hypothetical protein